METVELVCGHHVEVTLDLLDGEKVATHVEVAGVEMGTAPGKARIVEDGAFGHDDVAIGAVLEVVGQHLHKGLKGVEDASLGVGTYKDAVGMDLQQVALVA